MKYKNSYLIPGLKKLKKDLAPMTFGEKVDHIWSYYKEYMFVAAMVLMIVIAFCSSCINANRETLFSGLMANLSISQQGYDYLSTGYEKKLEANSNQQVELAYVYFQDLNTATEVEASYNSAIKAVAMTSAGTLDYMLVDDTALEFYINQELFMDLRLFFTPEELEQWKSMVIYAQPEGAPEMYPVAINLESLDFKQEAMGEETAYLAFTAPDEEVAACRDFWEYLLAWESE